MTNQCTKNLKPFKLILENKVENKDKRADQEEQQIDVIFDNHAPSFYFQQQLLSLVPKLQLLSFLSLKNTTPVNSLPGNNYLAVITKTYNRGHFGNWNLSKDPKLRP